MTKEQALKLGLNESPSGKYAEVTFTYPTTMTVKVPIEIVELEPEIEDKELAEWLEENVPEVSGAETDEIFIMDVL